MTCRDAQAVETRSQKEEEETTTESRPLLIAAIGKSGTGKSSLCNQIVAFGEEYKENDPDWRFAIGHGLNTETKKEETKNFTIKGEHFTFKVMDTPDGKGTMKKCVKLLKEHLYKSDDVVILFCVRCDARYALEEHRTYLKLKKHWQDHDDLKKRLILAFTHGESLMDYSHRQVPDHKSNSEKEPEKDPKMVNIPDSKKHNVLSGKPIGSFPHGESLTDDRHCQVLDDDNHSKKEPKEGLDMVTNSDVQEADDSSRPSCSNSGESKVDTNMESLRLGDTKYGTPKENHDTLKNILNQMMDDLKWPQLMELKKNAHEETFVFCNKETRRNDPDVYKIISYIIGKKSTLKWKSTGKQKQGHLMAFLLSVKTRAKSVIKNTSNNPEITDPSCARKTAVEQSPPPTAQETTSTTLATTSGTEGEALEMKNMID